MAITFHTCWTFIRRHAAYITFLLLATVILVADISFYYQRSLNTTQGTLNTHAIGNAEDYHQYMYTIKLGQEGHLLYHNVFSEETIPDVLLQPMFTLLGMVSRPFGLSVYAVYFVTQVLSLAILFWSMFVLIEHTFVRQLNRWLAVILYFSATGIWSIASLKPLGIQKMMLPDFNFNLFTKYNVIPPHHNIAIALVIGIVIVLSSRRRHAAVWAGLFSLLLGFIHPYIQLVTLIILMVNALYEGLSQRKIVTTACVDTFVVLVISLPVIMWNIYMQAVILRFTIATAGILTYLPRAQSVRDYFFSLGPLLVLAIPSLWYWKRTNKPLFRFLLCWGFTPVALFFFPDIHLPINTWRLFQIYQHIPLALLSVFAVSHIIRKKSLYTTVAIVLGLCALIYGGTIYAWDYDINVNPGPVDNYYNINVPNDLLALFSYLDAHTSRDSVVLAGSILSNLIPEFTHNRVIIGHNGDNRNYLAKLHAIGVFLSNKVPSDQVWAFLNELNVSYIVFGVDAPDFHSTSYRQLPFLREVYRAPDDEISVVKVLPETPLFQITTSP